jgi:hypothetical protein
MLPARDNPFRSERLDTLAFRYPAGLDRAALLVRLAALGHRAAIVGPEGSGKTTLSRELERGLTERYRVWRITQRRGDRRLARRLPRLGHDDFVILDGAEQLAPLSFWRLRRQTRSAGGLLVLSHRPGLLPTLVATETSQALLDELVAELTPAQACTVGLLARHGGNIRDALRALYDAYAGLPPQQDGRPGMLLSNGS